MTRTQKVGSPPTTELILREAARLFSSKGFHGTSTREIADAVGIRQPSLFHHFPSKHAIAEALFQYDYDRSPGLQLRPELPDATPPVRLFQITRREVLVELTSAYDLRGLYLSALMDDPEFAHWRATYEQSLSAAGDLISGLPNQLFDFLGGRGGALGEVAHF
ncbi:MAG TPA: helix-turn-helix domain-containing protein, partial [Nocardioides sp.]|nr:helix-turn-helix domain-containing protein [Nocardioides sp.]